MANIQRNSGRSVSSSSSIDISASKAFENLVLILGLVSIGIIIDASASTGFIVFILVVTVMMLAGLAERSKPLPKPATVLTICACAWATFGGLLVFKAHWLAFTPAAWVFNGLFLAALFAGVWRGLRLFAKSFAAMLAAFLIVATIVFPRPAGGEGALDTNEKWKIEVIAVDAKKHQPLEDARVLCGTVMRWESELTLPDSAARMTDAEGRAMWEFDDDPRLKIVICTVWKDFEGATDYPHQSQIVPAPAGGGEYRLTFAMKEDFQGNS